MNIYSIIIISAIIVSFLLQFVTEILNIRALSPELPDEFKDVYSKDAYSRSQEYTRVKTKFGFIIEIAEIFTLFIFWFGGWFNYLDIYIRKMEFSSITTGLIYAGTLLLSKSILFLPADIYGTFVIEEKFGFNKTKPGTYIADKFKALLLSIAIGGPILGLIFYIFESLGPFAWLYGWAATTIFTIFLQFVAPTWILPLFNKFTPLEEGDLKDSIMNYAKSMNFSLQNIFVMDGSRRSSKANAAFMGFGKNKRVALYDTLIEKHSVEELTAVLAHEIAHYKKKHILQSMLIGFIHSGFLFFLLSFFLKERGLFDAFYMEHISVYAGLIFFGLLFSPIETILSIFMNVLSRKNEYEADEMAAKTYKKPEALISALKKLSADNLSNLTPHPAYVFLNYSHPPVRERVLKLRAFD